MPSIKFSLFDAEDAKEWKAFEDAMMRAFLRALRVHAKEAEVDGYTPPAPEVVPTEEEMLLEADAPAPKFGALMNGGNAKPEPGPKPRQPRRTWSHFCKEVFTLPDGYVTIEKALSLIGGSPEAATAMIRKWVHQGEVKGVILCGGRMERTHGLGGHLMLNERNVTERNALRKERAALPISLRARVNGTARHHTGMPTGGPVASR